MFHIKGLWLKGVQTTTTTITTTKKDAVDVKDNSFFEIFIESK